MIEFFRSRLRKAQFHGQRRFRLETFQYKNQHGLGNSIYSGWICDAVEEETHA